ncbi:MAG: hypothetical protein H7249_03830 [Chitinophagaceae bacterium]|nr:hypothetical protein [Oligoflexus sp.]
MNTPRYKANYAFPIPSTMRSKPIEVLKMGFKDLDWKSAPSFFLRFA